MDEVSAVDGDHVLRAAVSYRGALHWVRAENNSTPRGMTWDTYDVPAGATWGDLFDLNDTDWRRLGFAKFSAPRPNAAAVVVRLAPATQNLAGGPRVGVRAAPGGGVVVAPLAMARRRQVAPWLFTRPYKAFSIPYWAALALTAVPAAMAVGREIRRAIRARRGLCPRCAYDLRATGERCPECGEPVPGRRAAAATT